MNTFTATAWQRRRLQQRLRVAHDARLYRRTLAVLEVARGESVVSVARRLGVTPRAVYHWVGDYARDHDPDALRDRPRPGRPSVLSDPDRSLLRELLARSPQDLGYAAVEWTVPLLRRHLADRTGRPPSDDTVRRELRRLGYTWKRSRYTLDPDPELGGKKAADSPANPPPTAPQRRPGGG
jgi:transposase